MLKRFATPEINLCAVEDPIELLFNQMQVQHNIGLDFASGIRTLMRQDPDIIMVGEIRDLETAEMAVQAALTGHLVISLRCIPSTRRPRSFVCSIWAAELSDSADGAGHHGTALDPGVMPKLQSRSGPNDYR